MNILAENINDDAQLLAQDFVNHYPNMFTEDKRFWRDAVAALLRIYGKHVEDEIKETLKGCKITV